MCSCKYCITSNWLNHQTFVDLTFLFSRQSTQKLINTLNHSRVRFAHLILNPAKVLFFTAMANMYMGCFYGVIYFFLSNFEFKIWLITLPFLNKTIFFANPQYFKVFSEVIGLWNLRAIFPCVIKTWNYIVFLFSSVGIESFELFELKDSFTLRSKFWWLVCSDIMMLGLEKTRNNAT